MKNKDTALLRIIQSSVTAIQAACKYASFTAIAIFTLLLFALPTGVKADVTVTTLAGTAAEYGGSADGTGTAAQFAEWGPVFEDVVRSWHLIPQPR